MADLCSTERSKTPLEIVQETLTVQRTQSLWTANYFPVLPFSTQDFEIGALLPAILYMARFGQRRGKGKFFDTFGAKANIADVANVLLKRPEFIGFNSDAGPAILGDLLLAGCLENRAHKLGQQEPVQRVFPSHYLASWIDLPNHIGNLRGVPEFLTALLANQSEGEWLEVNQHRRFSIGVKFEENILLTLFGKAMKIRGNHATNLSSDEFDEEAAQQIGIEELLLVRLAQTCGTAPSKARGKNSPLRTSGQDESERIPNRHPLARRAAECLREDLAIFIEIYGTDVPRQSFLQMLESGIALGLTNLLLSTVNLIEVWEQEGKIPTEQPPWPLFVDCSTGQDKKLRDLAEDSMAECIRRYERLPVRMMLLRVLDNTISEDEDLKKELPSNSPNKTAIINFLGDIYHVRHSESKGLLKSLGKDCQRLAKALEQENQSLEVAERLLKNEISPALRLAEALCDLMGDNSQRNNFMKALESSLLTDQPNGLTIKRRVQRTQNGTKQPLNRRAVVLNPPLLDFLVHRHLRPNDKSFQPLSLQIFLKLLRERYGLYVDQSPPGQPISQSILLRNKSKLEQRLRDLGLLLGVNDAESMKQLQPRYLGKQNV